MLFPSEKFAILMPTRKMFVVLRLKGRRENSKHGFASMQKAQRHWKRGDEIKYTVMFIAVMVKVIVPH